MGDKKFRAFISYSHADEAWGGWLQRSLEKFRAPKSLAQAIEGAGGSARLAPIFRDREDLPVAGSLNSAIQAALADSEFQIVLCSPNSAKSKWVNEEIKLFHKLNGPGRVFALIIAGEPNATNILGREAEECFPPALRVQLTAEGDETEAPAEPLAADAREQGDGKRYALLKVAAGMLGVGLDDLVRRDAQRRARMAWIIAGASTAGMTATAALALFAIAKSNEANLMRGKAENLIEFMLTDLNQKLEPVGRLDVLESVVDKAMDYYADQDLQSLDDDALARRAKAMMQLGTVDERRNNFNAARKAFESAEAATGELLRRSPNNPDRIFDHAQNVFYVGEIAGERYDRNTHAMQNYEYLRLAQRLVAIEPNNPRSQLELAYATNNLGNIKFGDGLYKEAIPFYEESIASRADLLAQNPDDDKLRRAYAYAISWYAYAFLQMGDYQSAIEQFNRQLDAYGRLADLEYQDFSALDAVVTAQRRLASAYLLKGDINEAHKANSVAEVTAETLVERDQRNANWSVNAAYIARDKSIILMSLGDLGGAKAAADRSVHLIESAITEDAPQLYYKALGKSLALQTLLLGEHAKLSDVERVRELTKKAIEEDPLNNAGFIAEASVTLSRFYRNRGENVAAQAILERSIEAIEPVIKIVPADAKISLAAVYLEAGARDKAASLIAELDQLRIRHPEFVALKDEFASAAVQ